MNEAMKIFEKTAGEMNGLQQRLESAYEDMGTVLNRYYKINEALSDESEVEEDINISAKAFKKMNPNKIQKLARKTDINIEETNSSTAKHPGKAFRR
jgi:hypothetical protein